MKVGIIGLGFVGNAIRMAFDKYGGPSPLVLVDPAKGYTNTYEDLVSCDAIFVCVPSPQGDDGSCDTSILEDVLAKLRAVNFNGTVISKCTAPPDVYNRLNDEYPNLIHAPEFLTAANAVEDYARGTFVFIGGNVPAHKYMAERVIRESQTELSSVYYCSIGEAALAKYAINSFLATKVVFMNELYKMATKAGLDYDKVSAMIRADSRIGTSHMQVPGPDGSFGFGGMCFPKDTAALLKYAESLNLNMNVVDAAVKKNTLLRLTEPK
jgi:UDPglucose 6-dehydrogenase